MMYRHLSDHALTCLVQRVLQAIYTANDDSIATLTQNLPRVFTVHHHELG